MRVLAVTPIHLPGDEIRRRQARYDRLAPAGLRIDLRDVGPAAPTALNTAEEVRASEDAVTATFAELGADFDALLPDCVLDPGVPDTVVTTTPRVCGLLKLSAAHLADRGAPFGAVVRNDAIAAELGRRLKGYGLGDYVAGISVLDLPVEAITDTRTWNSALTEAVRELAGKGATAVLNGCSAVDVAEAERAAAIVDPTALALRLLALEYGVPQ